MGCSRDQTSHRRGRPSARLLWCRLGGLAIASVVLWFTSVTIAGIHAPRGPAGTHPSVPQGGRVTTGPDTEAGESPWLTGELAPFWIKTGAPAAPPARRSGSTLRVHLRPGESLERLFRRLGLDAVQATLLARSPGGAALQDLKAGQVIELVRDGARLESLGLDLDLRRRLEARRHGAGFQVAVVARPLERRVRYAGGTIRHSLFDAGLAAGLSDRLILELVAIFGWDVDFLLDLRTGDRFTVAYETWYDRGGRRVGDGHILAAEFVNRGRVLRAIGHPDQEGRLRYFTPEGESLRRAFLRSPVKFTRISSGFRSRRFHPVLKRWRAHRGVDYAAPRGAPVHSTADGRVVFVGSKGGYGRTVIIRHGGRYSTLYAHLRGFARGLKRGQRVRQGQVIGYVGATGLATGPHLHYEFRVNGVHRNPLTVAHPRARRLAGSERSRFLAAAGNWQAVLDRLGGGEAGARLAMAAGP